jgi:hypothetical protein
MSGELRKTSPSGRGGRGPPGEGALPKLERTYKIGPVPPHPLDSSRPLPEGEVYTAQLIHNRV